MATVSESYPTRPIHDALVAGVDMLGQNQTVTFVPYVRTVLPADGYVFWLRASLLSAAQLAQHGLSSADPVTVHGSLHYAIVGSQVSDETLAIRAVDFTAETAILALAELAPDVMFIGEWWTPLGTFKFTFSRRNRFYYQASLFHYEGDAVYPAFEAQLVDDLSEFDQSLIVSNSLPIWLAMFVNVPIYSPVTISIPVYPAYLVPDNLLPAYVAVEIVPNSTRALQSVPSYDRRYSHSQLSAERVRLTAYGTRNADITDLMDYVLNYSATTGDIGLMNAPIVRDEHRIQVELAALAQKKTIDWEISYFQNRARDLARQLILSGGVTLPVVDLTPDRITSSGIPRVSQDGRSRIVAPPFSNVDLVVPL